MDSLPRQVPDSRRGKDFGSPQQLASVPPESFPWYSILGLNAEIGAGERAPSGKTFVFAGVVFTTTPPFSSLFDRWNNKTASPDPNSRMKRMPAITSHQVRAGRVQAGGGGLGADSGGAVSPSFAGTSGEVSFTSRCSISFALWGRSTGSFAKQAAIVFSQICGIASPSIPSSALRSATEGRTFPLARSPISLVVKKSWFASQQFIESCSQRIQIVGDCRLSSRCSSRAPIRKYFGYVVRRRGPAHGCSDGIFDTKILQV